MRPFRQDFPRRSTARRWQDPVQICHKGSTDTKRLIVLDPAMTEEVGTDVGRTAHDIAFHWVLSTQPSYVSSLRRAGGNRPRIPGESQSTRKRVKERCFVRVAKLAHYDLGAVSPRGRPIVGIMQFSPISTPASCGFQRMIFTTSSLISFPIHLPKQPVEQQLSPSRPLGKMRSSSVGTCCSASGPGPEGPAHLTGWIKRMNIVHARSCTQARNMNEWTD